MLKFRILDDKHWWQTESDNSDTTLVVKKEHVTYSAWCLVSEAVLEFMSLGLIDLLRYDIYTAENDKKIDPEQQEVVNT